MKAQKVTKLEKAKLVGAAIARKATELGLSKVVFDRSGYLYHGRVKAVADGAREGGLTILDFRLDLRFKYQIFVNRNIMAKINCK